MITLLLVTVLFFAGSDDWRMWSPRSEIAPAGGMDGALSLSGNSKVGVFGGWERVAGDVEPGSWYRLRAAYRSEGITHEPLHVLARLDWRGADGQRRGQPDYAVRAQTASGWQRVEVTAPAPEGATAAALQLLLVNAPMGRVWWQDVHFDKVAAPAPRLVRVASVNFIPPRTASPAETVHRYLELAAGAIQSADLILFPEGMTGAGSHRPYIEAAEPVPGPSTAALGDFARSRKSYVVAGLFERDGTAVYNTAVLIDRQGRLAGRYRKVYLPREEYEGGLAPGNSYPVFETDFGRLGLMICWDLQYSDPARAMALNGAEVLAMPIAGGSEVLGRARAIENHVFLISSGLQYPTRIVDPAGEVVAVAPGPGTIASATIDLSKRYTDPWLGNMRDRFFHEIRDDVR